MSRTLEALIKVHTHALDEQRRVVNQLEEAKARTLQMIDDLHADMARQRDVARADVELARGLPAYLDAALARERSYRHQLEGLQGMIDIARTELQNRFADLKKYEIANDAEREKLRQERLAQENAALDETAGQRAARENS